MTTWRLPMKKCTERSPGFHSENEPAAPAVSPEGPGLRDCQRVALGQAFPQLRTLWDTYICR